ncbi:hypothetical protein [Nonomuraea sp. NPDC003709]|uniref:hypothetical protein n=1 Tax=Nonomuraea sp. NPDC003709 TaxID=3154450 RepID=UPI0033AD42AD
MLAVVVVDALQHTAESTPVAAQDDSQALGIRVSWPEAVATPPAEVSRAHALIRAGHIGEVTEVLRVAADERGDAPADRDLGRLPALRRHQAVFNLGERREAEERLMRSGGGDPVAACALINLYAMAADEIRQDPWEEGKAARLAHCRDRAAELYDRALAAAPPNSMPNPAAWRSIIRSAPPSC